MAKNKNKACTVELTSREVIEKKLLTQLGAKGTVAILCSKKDLDLIILAFETQSNKEEEVRKKLLEFCMDLKQLRQEAFGYESEMG